MILKSKASTVFGNQDLSAAEVKAVPGSSPRVMNPSSEVAAIAMSFMEEKVVNEWNPARQRIAFMLAKRTEFFSFQTLMITPETRSRIEEINKRGGYLWRYL